MLIFFNIFLIHSAVLLLIQAIFDKISTLHAFQKMADNDDDSSSDCPLHKCVFYDEIRKLSQLLRTNDVAQRDKHGN